MQTKTLRTIQTLSKIGKILCTIIFIFSLIGAIGCAVGVLGLALIPEGLKIGDVTIHSIIENKAAISLGTCYTAMASGIVICAGEAVLCKFAKRYFVNELAAGTPFTFEGARELIRLGILTICIPIAAAMTAGIVTGVMSHVLGNVSDLHISDNVSVGLGIMFIVTGLICRHGAEISQNKEVAKIEE